VISGTTVKGAEVEDRPRDRFGCFVQGAIKQKPAVEPQEPTSGNGKGKGDLDHLDGIGAIPRAWGDLPPNASLPAEIAWVQANRLTVVDESQPGKTIVRLRKARSPAPSHAALGWLETSIRSYAKYVDVVARSLAVVQDEQDHIRRERLALTEIDSLLDV
jgi:hypothetical protein